MKKLLILSTIPVPYRTEVFLGLAKHYRADIFFERSYDQNRNDKYFVTDEGFTMLNSDEGRKRYQSCLRRLREYDLVLAYDYTSKKGMQLMLRCIRQGVPYCLNCDGAFINPHPVKDWIKRFFIRRARACFCSGDSAREYFLHYGARQENLYLHDFTSLTEKDIFPNTANREEKKKLREKNGLEDTVLVLTIGQFIYRKGFDILLEAWRQVRGNCRLLMVGGGEKQQEYEAFIAKYGMDNVTLVGYLDKSKIFEYYRASDLFVLPTREDVWGLVVNEAMACGIPVISSDMCIAGRELIKEGINGYVVPSEDVDRLAEALQKLVNQPALREEMGRNNIRDIQGKTLQNIVESHIKVIDSL